MEVVATRTASAWHLVGGGGGTWPPGSCQVFNSSRLPLPSAPLQWWGARLIARREEGVSQSYPQEDRAGRFSKQGPLCRARLSCLLLGPAHGWPPLQGELCTKGGLRSVGHCS